MSEVKWILKIEDEEKGYLKETKEYIYTLKEDLIKKILSSPKKTNAIGVNSIPYNLKDNR
jgi:hypothetical protein